MILCEVWEEGSDVKYRTLAVMIDDAPRLWTVIYEPKKDVILNVQSVFGGEIRQYRVMPKVEYSVAYMGTKEEG